MSKRTINRPGTYVVKAAESRPARVAAKRDGQASTPTGNDRRLAREVFRSKRG